ncbi:Haem-degrading [Aliiruegeria lutimaris]|uniref:Haem-degrading n=1 Tax=Aliiruegeria lutimaris TaxID=571298 RepID=A0A1G9GLP1_9RHOB|nr:heme-binding protein [Aliiruegeria lutimaris]SDL01618.1 Haem-degrading [Aliiruegeria lutimaris]
MKCEDGSGIIRFDVAFGKAWRALGMGISSRLIGDRLSNRPTFQFALATASDGQLIPLPGGVLIRDAVGINIGAVGISGDTSDKDEYCAIKAIHAAALTSEPAEPDPGWHDSSFSDHSP